jgi:hypothetical protein
METPPPHFWQMQMEAMRFPSQDNWVLSTKSFPFDLHLVYEQGDLANSI